MSETGRDQAKAVAERLKRLRPAAVYASPRERAQATAAEIAARARLELQTEPALDEIDFGEWTDLSFAELEGDPDWDRWNRIRGRAAPPGGESMSAAADRAYACLARMHAAHRDQTVILVSHADIIRGTIARVLGLSLDHLLRFDIDPASASTVAVEDWGCRVTALNERVAA